MLTAIVLGNDHSLVGQLRGCGLDVVDDLRGAALVILDLDTHDGDLAATLPLLIVSERVQPDLSRFARYDGPIAFLAKSHVAAHLYTVVSLLQMQYSRRTDREARAAAAVEANHAKTVFLAHMSHELRTPLTAVLGLSEALVDRTFGPLSDEQAQALVTIHGSGRHLLDLINDVLDVARVEAGQLSIEPEETLLRPLLDDSVALMSSALSARGQRIVVDLPATLPSITVDRRRMKQVLLNLLGNAVKFSPFGATVGLRVVTDPKTRTVAITISDAGVGIATEDLDRIFEPFVSISENRMDGAGLGLPLAQRIVELHRGSLTVESERDRGARFTITLPCHLDPGSEQPTEPFRPRRAPIAFRETLLLAEDNAATVFTVRSYLEKCGFSVRVVNDGASAIEAAQAPDIAVVLMDVGLGGVDGLTAMRRLRAAGVTKPMVALTAHTMPGDEARCLEAGASAYMAKPVRLRELLETIEGLI